LAQLDAVPGFRRCPKYLVQAQALSFRLDVPHQPVGVEQPHEPMQVRVLFDQRPVEPADLVVVAVGVVVAPLGAPYLVAHRDHRQAQ
jgi:hypothetical protein